ncbi:endolytic transglycosylase MltG [Candidatus Saccharibacteria bacterium]|nr:endolytic transglycosylase MltG [Candidatus Saccharibacteria bacterium]
MKIIGLDIGTKRIGVARADSSTRIAIPSGYILVDGSEWQKIAKLAKLYSTNWFVLGLPRSNEGNETKQSMYVRQFAKRLLKEVPEAKIRFQDESLTSVEAENRLKARGKNYEKGDIDSEAATIILQDFLESFNKGGSDTSSSSGTLPRARLHGARSLPERPAGRSNPSEEGYQNPINSIKTVAKKESDKVVMTAKKTKHKMKKWPILVLALILIGGGVAGGIWWINRENAKREYEAYLIAKANEKAEVFNFTIRPGETIFDIKESLAEVGYSATEIEEAFDADYDFDFLKNRPEGATLEGYLYGETHEFYKTATVKEILTKFLEGMGEVIRDNNLEARYAAHDLTLFEGITLASIVQKESPNGEHATVAQVFLSRLAYGWRLGSDVTVKYALDVVDPNRLTYADNAAALTIDSCYNTRIHTGLPCGPISNPNLTSLLAVADPSDTSYLYFLTGDDGLMYYSYTEAEHNQNAYQHCQNLCNVSL